MYKYLLESVDGIQWFGIASLVLFFCFFTFATVRTLMGNKEEMEKMAQLPFDE